MTSGQQRGLGMGGERRAQNAHPNKESTILQQSGESRKETATWGEETFTRLPNGNPPLKEVAGASKPRFLRDPPGQAKLFTYVVPIARIFRYMEPVFGLSMRRMAKRGVENRGYQNVRGGRKQIGGFSGVSFFSLPQSI